MDKRLLDILVCPISKGRLQWEGDELWSIQTALAYPIRNNIPVLVEAEARTLELDEVERARQRGRGDRSR